MPAPSSSPDTPQDLGQLDGKLVVWNPERAAELRALEGITCPYCGGGLEWSARGFVHLSAAGHPPMTWEWHQHVMNLEERLRRVLPSAHIARYMDVAGAVVELVVLTPQGGKLGVIVPGSVHDAARIRRQHQLMLDHGVRPLVVIPEPLVSISSPKRAKTRRIKIDELAMTVLSLGLPLWLSRLSPRQILHVIVHPDTRPLWAGPKPLGLVEAVLREYPISQLRLNQGMLATLGEWDPALPEFRPLPARLAKLL
jgi:hypothetical protein